MAVAGAAWVGRLSRYQSWNGLALCRGSRIAGASAVCRMESSTANCRGPCAFGGSHRCACRSDPCNHPACRTELVRRGRTRRFRSLSSCSSTASPLGGMRVGFRDLTFWSFSMASAHGAGLMLVPVFLGTTPQEAAHKAHGAHSNQGGGSRSLGFTSSRCRGTFRFTKNQPFAPLRHARCRLAGGRINGKEILLSCNYDHFPLRNLRA
jgi:hypothetical protein